MKTGVLAVCDPDPDYTQNLMEYISQKAGMPFKTIAFTNVETLLKYTQSEQIDVLMISNSAMNERVEACAIEKVILLSSGEIFSKYKGYPSIYKYQSTEKIIREVLDYYAEIYHEEETIPAASGHAGLIGVYAPQGLESGTLLALALSKMYAHENTVLYISMEEFSTLHELMEKTYASDLSDLMYYYRQNPAGLNVRLQGVIEHYQGFDYIPPPAFSGDLREVRAQEWLGLIQAIDSFGIYDYIILQISPMVENPFEMLEFCRKVYVPFREGYLSETKMQVFEKYLLTGEKEALFHKMLQIKMPELSDAGTGLWYLEKQLTGIMETLAQYAGREEYAV